MVMVVLTDLAFQSHVADQPRQPGAENLPVRQVRRF
jgi:hypothetical protein